uniref:Homeobox protein homothorax n=1 Tax=Syphacia muris TaxID=451379 RepID=A0A0N5B0G4_9BILA
MMNGDVQKDDRYREHNCDMSPSPNIISNNTLSAPVCSSICATPPAMSLGAMSDYKASFTHLRPKLETNLLARYPSVSVSHYADAYHY